MIDGLTPDQIKQLQAGGHITSDQATSILSQISPEEANATNDAFYQSLEQPPATVPSAGGFVGPPRTEGNTMVNEDPIAIAQADAQMAAARSNPSMAGAPFPGRPGPELTVAPGVSSKVESGNQEGTRAKATPAAASTGPAGPMYGAETEDTSTKTTMGPKGQKAMDEAAAAQKEYVDARQAADLQHLDLQRAKAEAEKNTLDEYNQKINAQNVAIQQEWKKRTDEINKLQSEFDGMSIDSGRMFGSGNTSGRIMAIIGMSLGAMGGALAKHDFGVNQMIQKAIDNDIDAQKADMMKKDKSIQNRKGALQDYMQISRDMQSATELEKARQLGIIEKQFASIEAATGNAEVKAKAAQMRSDMANERAKILAQTEKNQITNITKTMPLKGAVGEAWTDTAMEQQRNSASAVGLLRELKQLKKSVPTGFFDGNWDKLKAKMGWADGDLVKFQSALAQVQGRLTKEMFGGQASDKDFETAKTATPNQIMNDKAFEEAIKRLEDNAIKGMKTRSATEKLNGKRDIPHDQFLREYQPVNEYTFQPLIKGK